MMVEGEATQEPTAPESAPASPPTDSAVDPALAAAASPPTDAAPDEETPSESLAADGSRAEAPSAQETPGEDSPAQDSPGSSAEASSAEASPAVSPSDWSHLRGFQAVEAPADMSRPDYAEELGKEIAARAARFARSVDESIVLSSDGVMRWLGDPVARVVGGDDLLQPRAVLLADQALAGEDRAAVETRAALWLSAHLRKVLGPLLALAESVELSEAARALGGKIVEALGVLDRDRVRNDVRGLDQTARGALRKLGVRFGSLYIYVPVLLKPGARSLCSLLWTLRRGPEPGADRLLAFASAGRTSFANEGLLSPDAYRVAGFRLCGERVVRVDIIERLSDLIRAAIPDHLRAGSRPASEAYGFLVTPQMTSLTGCSGEAFSSILRSLGFEPVKVGKAAFEAANAKAPMEPIKPPVAETAPEGQTAAESEPPAEAAAETEIAQASAEADAPESQAVAENEPAAEATEEVEATADEAGEVATGAAQELEAEPAHEAAEVQASADAATEARAPEVEAEAREAQAGEAEAAEAAGEVESAPAGETVEPQASDPAENVSAEAAIADESAPAADEEIEIWRPAPRRPRAQRPHHEPRAEREARPHRGKPQRRENRPAGEAPEARAQAPHRPPRPERRDEGPRRFDGKGEGREDRRPHKDFGPRRDQRPTQIDPDSPFAKLAALKPLLERRDKRP
jgi:ATP-dependent RNA helicase SUPV3L1/SUV3